MSAVSNSPLPFVLVSPFPLLWSCHVRKNSTITSLQHENAAINSPRDDDDAQKSHTRNSLHVMLLIDRAHNAPVWASSQVSHLTSQHTAPYSAAKTRTSFSPVHRYQPRYIPAQTGRCSPPPPTSQDPCISRPPTPRTTHGRFTRTQRYGQGDESHGVSQRRG